MPFHCKHHKYRIWTRTGLQKSGCHFRLNIFHSIFVFFFDIHERDYRTALKLTLLFFPQYAGIFSNLVLWLSNMFRFVPFTVFRGLHAISM